MKVGKLDVLFIILVGAVFATWNFGGNTQVYYSMQSKLRKQQEILPGFLVNPLAEFSSVSKQAIESKEDDQESEEESGEEEDRSAEEEEELGEESGDRSGSQAPLGGELELNEEEKRSAQEEARAMLLEDTLLNIKLEEMRKTLDKGLLPADRRLSFTVQQNPSDLADLTNMDDEERDFAEKLQAKMNEWAEVVDLIDRAASGKSLDTDDKTWQANIEDQLKWEEQELKRLREAIRLEEKATLSGREVHERDFYEEGISAELSDYDEYAEGGKPSSSSSSSSSSSKDQDKSIKIKPKKVEVHNLALDGHIAEYQEHVKHTEEEISYWAHPTEKAILVFGSSAYVHRDIDTYHRAFSKAGFSMDKRKKEGPLSTKVLLANTHPVLICLALKNDDCFSSAGLTKVRRYQRINRITGLRAVLWSKDSFCKTISSGTKGEPMFSDYTFHCWIFPNEYTSAREYAQMHPDDSFIVKPLTMGGGKGITVVDGEKGLKGIRFKTHIVQNYLGNPHLINNHKWDIRSYVLVTSTVPMRAYVYSRGLIRFASSPYDPSAKHGGKKSQYLTNTSVNKKFVKQNVTDITWAFSDLKRELDNGAPGSFDTLFKRMQTAISIVFLSAEQEWRRYYNSKGESCHNCFQILGVDLIVDSGMNPRVIEVNGQPNMKQSKDKKDHYSITKQSMMEDMVSMIFNEESVTNELLIALQDVDGPVLKTLTQNDWEYLIEYMKERKFRGGWKKVYPNTADDKIHSAFLEQQKPNPARLALHDVLMHLEKATKGMRKN